MRRSITEQALYDIDKALLRRKADKAVDDFYTFFRYFAWPVLEPATLFIDNWHIHAMCEHLQAVSNDEIHRLLINIPFRQLKSRAVSQAWPSWEWIRKPHLQYLTGSYARDLATRDAVDSRRIIESEGYIECWGDRYRMTSDQNVKTRYENDKRGMRTITSTDSAATGFGGNRLVVDDPLSAKMADSEIDRLACIEWWRGTVATRFNNPETDAAVIVGQRLHADDLSGWVLQNQPNKWEHLVFPMRYEPTRPVYISGKVTEVSTKTVCTKLGYTDPRTIPGELLNPRRISEEGVQSMEEELGAYHTAAQLQQRPDSRSGAIFLRNHWNFYKALPDMDECILSVDCTFKDTDGTDYVAIQVIGRKGANKYLLKRTKQRMGFAATVLAVRATKALYPKAIAVLIEDKANGSAVIETIKKEIPGVIPITPDGGKTARAYAIQPQHEAGNFFLPDPTIDPQIETFLGELSSFPNGANDDETDAWTQGVNWYMSRERKMGIMDFYRQEAKELAEEQDKLKAKQNG